MKYAGGTRETETIMHTPYLIENIAPAIVRLSLFGLTVGYFRNEDEALDYVGDDGLVETT